MPEPLTVRSMTNSSAISTPLPSAANGCDCSRDVYYRHRFFQHRVLTQLSWTYVFFEDKKRLLDYSITNAPKSFEIDTRFRNITVGDYNFARFSRLGKSVGSSLGRIRLGSLSRLPTNRFQDLYRSCSFTIKITAPVRKDEPFINHWYWPVKFNDLFCDSFVTHRYTRITVGCFALEKSQGLQISRHSIFLTKIGTERLFCCCSPVTLLPLLVRLIDNLKSSSSKGYGLSRSLSMWITTEYKPS